MGSRTIQLRFPGLLLILALSATLHSRAVATELTTLKTRFYEIHHNLDQGAITDIGLHMDRVYAEYDRRMKSFPGRRSDAAPLYVFQTREQYLDHLASKGINGKGSGGMFYHRPGETGSAALVVYTENHTDESLKSLLQHEGFHQFAYMKIGDTLPLWANEGLAEYFGRGRVENGKFFTGFASDADVRILRERARNGELTSIEQLVNTTSEQWLANNRAGKGGAQYLESWALVQFLVHAEKGQYQPFFLRFMKDLARGVDADRAFKSAFRVKSYDPVEPRFRAFLDRELRQGRPAE